MKKFYLIMPFVCMLMMSFKPDGGEEKHQGHEYVDLGLSVKWATCNIGASSPEGYGDYFAWGETNTKARYEEYNSKTYCKPMSDISGNAQYDVAKAKWGGEWRMPTGEEMDELLNECTWTWELKEGVKGYKITGPNGNSIFLPAAGSRNGASLSSTGESGNYWSSTHGEYEDYDAFYLYFHGGIRYKSCNLRDNGQSVRPVID
ncbi:MAG: DUF1566 domain-containing protein [Bacteroidales bacterium]|nr:DUF1566 domain-containing protein [Bacteroidales bacterium]